MKTIAFFIGLLVACLLSGSVMAVEYSEIDHCGCDVPSDHYANLELDSVQTLMEALDTEYSVVDIDLNNYQFMIVVQQPVEYAGTALTATVKSWTDGKFVENNDREIRSPYIDEDGKVYLFVDVPTSSDGNFLITVSGDGFYGDYQAFAHTV